MLKNDDIPINIKNILTDVQNKLPKYAMVVLAGGALRDLICDRNINDLDIFIRAGVFDMTMVETIFGAEPVKKDMEFLDYLEQKGEKIRISRAYTYYDKGYEVNLVFMPDNFTTMSLIEDFDFGICQIGFDGHAVYHTKNFEDDITNKTLTIINGNHSREVHTKKMMDKFPDFKLSPAFEDLL